MAKLPDLFGRGVLASRPSAGIEGRHYVATDDTPDTMYRDNGSTWDAVATVGAGTVTTTRGDLIRRGASADERYALGATGKFLTSDGTDAVWGQGPLTTTGDLLIGAIGGTPTRLAAGATSGHVLTSNGSGAAPSWQAASGSSGGTISRLGKTAVGGSSESTANTRIYCKAITISGKRILLGAAMYLTPNAGGNVPLLGAAIALDAAGALGEIIAISAPLTPDLAGETSSPTSRWVHVPLGMVIGGDATYGDGTYWLQFAASPTTNSWTVFYDGSGTDLYYQGTGSWFMDGALVTETSSTKDYSLYVNTLPVS